MKTMMYPISHSMLIDDFDGSESIHEKIWKEKYNLSRKTLRRLDKEYIRLRDSACTLIEVRDELIARGVGESSLKHTVNDFSDKLEVSINDIVYELNIPLFPKRKAGGEIGLSTGDRGIRHNFEITSTPAGIAQFIIALSEWMPDYLSIEERITGEETKKQIACNIALDLLEKTFADTLITKGYQYHINRFGGSKIATLSISIDKALTMTFKIDLLEDFLLQLTRVIESLPDNQQEQISMLSLKNILNCALMENFDDDLIERLKKGGHNVILHDGRLWVPNISFNALRDSENVRIYTKQDILPEYAPIGKLKTIDTKLGEYVKDLSDAGREQFLQRLVSGVGFAGHYNRHRYKIPAEILNEVNDYRP